MELEPPSFEVRCEGGDAEACLELSINADDGAQRISWLERGCMLHHTTSCYRLGSLTGQYELQKKAVETELGRCEAGEPDGCFIAQTRFGETVPPALWTVAIGVLEPRCNDGEGAPCARLAEVLWEGHGGVKPDRKRAIELRYRACELGQGQECLRAVTDYESGDIVAKDPERVTFARERGCEVGNGHLCVLEAEDMKNRGVTGKLVVAKLVRGCKLGDDTSCFGALEYLDIEKGETRDPITARKLRERLCKHGSEHECITVAELAEKEHDLSSARAFYALGCKGGNATEGCGNELRIIKATCTPDAACPAFDTRLAELAPTARDVARATCCGDAYITPTTPAMALLMLQDAIQSKDPVAVLAQLHPKRPLQLRMGWHGGGDSGERIVKVTHTALDMDKLEGALSFHRNRFECEELVNRKATCTAFEGGFQAAYDVILDGGRTYVVRADEESH